MGQKIDLQTELYEKYWFPMEQSYGNDYASTFDWFIRDYLSVKMGAIAKIGKVYEEFKNYVQGSKSPDSITEIVADIAKYSKFYVNMVLRKEADKDLNRLFANISKLKVDVSYPFILAVYADYDSGIVTKEEFAEILKLVENYVFRRAICGIPTNSMNKTFAQLYKSVKTENYVESVKAAFQLMDGYKRFPADPEFEKEFVNKDVYNFRSRNYLLSKLENYNRKEAANTEEYTIEHILPQNEKLSVAWQQMLGDNWKKVQTNYLHTIGNLTLTGYNSELSDRSFADKKTMEGGFNDSPLRLNSFMKTVDVWNEGNINKRAKELAQKAKHIWFAPNLSEETLQNYKRKEEKEIAEYTIDQYEYLTGEKLELYEVLRRRVLNIDSSVKEEYKKLYIAFKSQTNFVDVVPQKSWLRLSLNMEYSDIIDPEGWCKDVSGIGRWGNGDVEVAFNNINQLEYIMSLIQQAFDLQFVEN